MQRFALAAFPAFSATLGAVTAAAMILHGYHPYIVDASIYIAGIKKRLNPALYSTDSAFIASHAHYSAFSLLMSSAERLTQLPLEWLIFAAYVASLFVFFLACYHLGARLFSCRMGGWGATLLMAAVMPIPVAATALLLIDPYLTARSLSSPLSLLAVLACAHQRWRAAALLCLATALAHPQMGVYVTAFVIISALVADRRWRAITVLCGLAFAACAAVWLANLHVSVSPSYREAILSRDFYFPGRWHWYELAGLLAPIALMSWTAWRDRVRTPLGQLAATCAIVGATSCLGVFCFVHTSGSYLLARLQLLRTFHTIYAVGIVMLGGAIATRPSARLRMAAAAVLVALAAGMFRMQRATFTGLANVEMPGLTMQGPWEQGFVWIRANTQPTAMFAMDPARFNVNESAPGFRALAERSLLTDVKDEGVASLLPALAPEWAANRDRQIGLEQMSDGQRVLQLRGTPVNWLLLSVQAQTSLPCPFHNAVMQVCRLTPTR